MTLRPTLLAPLALLATALPTTAQETAPAAAAKEARIPFPAMVSDFRTDGTDTLYLRAGRQWYRATFIAPCLDLPWAWQIAFKPSGGIGGIDRFTTILLPHREECRLASLVKIDGTPPDHAKKPNKK